MLMWAVLIGGRCWTLTHMCLCVLLCQKNKNRCVSKSVTCALYIHGSRAGTRPRWSALLWIVVENITGQNTKPPNAKRIQETKGKTLDLHFVNHFYPVVLLTRFGETCNGRVWHRPHKLVARVPPVGGFEGFTVPFATLTLKIKKRLQ